MISNSLTPFLVQQVDTSGEIVFNYTKDVSAIGSNRAKGKKNLETLTTDNFIVNFRYEKAKEIIVFPDSIRYNRCPHVTLFCKGGLLLAKEEIDEKGFTPFISIYFWTIAFTGQNFKSVGLHQWKGWSWGIPEEKDLIELDKWNIPGEIQKHNAKIKSIADAVVDALKELI
jgi:hypothetical protein